MNVYELNMDGLVGPTHHYAGLAAGNVASFHNAYARSNPQAAALQGLEKMRLLFNMGLKQGVMPPHQRPNLHLLHELGFTGTPEQQITKAYKEAPELLCASYSAAGMWTANAATVSPSSDTGDGKVHVTAANLITNLHRHHEAEFSKELLSFIFSNPYYFQHHPILPRSLVTSDEGAANHNRLSLHHHTLGIHLFVYGKHALQKHPPLPQHFPARQTKEASMAIARAHQLAPEHVIFAHQNPAAIDKGVFHNDVISVANESVYLIHEGTFLNQADVLKELREKASFPLNIIELSEQDISLDDAVATYLFNSQLITLPQTHQMMLLAPIECQHHPRAKTCIDGLIADPSNPITKAVYLDLKQSMRNGGGPACLRLRVPLNEDELNAMHQSVLINASLLEQLEQWILKHYRTDLVWTDLGDPKLIQENFVALDELTQVLDLGSIYPFQRES